MYLDARKAGNILLPNQIQLADRAEIIVTSLAKLGITALIDEATGYQQIRARDALQAYLDRVLRKELAVWVKRFPDEFYEQMYRLKKWKWSGSSSRRPQVAANYTTNIVYSRLGPGILDQLQKINPKTPKGLHSSVATELGIDLKSGWLKDFGGIAAGQDVQAYMHTIQMEIQGFPERVEIEAGFADSDAIGGLLGGVGFLDNYKVTLEKYKGRFRVESRPVREHN